MSKDVENRLLEQHKKVLEKCQYDGIGDGWFVLVDTLCHGLQHLTDNGAGPQVHALQIKQKFGELCFYAEGCDSLQAGMIYMASLISMRTCEVCGSPGERVEQEGHWQTLCPAHTQGS